MAKTYAQIVADASQMLQDPTNAIFATTEFDSFMDEALVFISQYKPWEYRLTKATVADSYDIALSAGDLWRLLIGSGYKGTGIEKAEYTIDQTPRRFRGVNKFGNTLTLEVNTKPSGANCYLYMNKVHLLQSDIGTTDTAGAIKTLAAIGATTLSLKSLGTGTINEKTFLTIAGDSKTYVVIAQATIASNEATVSIWPPLVAQAAVDAVVTLALADSTLDVILEGYLARYLAAKAAISKATLSYAQVNTAITTIGLAVTAVSNIAARITQGVADVASGRTSAGLGATAITSMATIISRAITDFSSGRTEAAQVSAIIDLANREIDLILPKLNQAATDIAAGRIEVAKVPTIIIEAGMAIGSASARISQALTDISSARTAIGLGVTAIANANLEFSKTDTELSGSKAALLAGNRLLNTVPLGGGSAEYMAQASAGLGLVQGYVLSGQSYLQKASADFNNANVDYGLASRELETSSLRLREAQSIIERANAELAVNRAYIEQAIAQLRVAQGLMQEAQGYILEANTRMANVSVFVRLGDAELKAATTKGQEAAADHANAASYFNAAANEFRAATEKANEAIANLRLVATRMQVSQGGLRYEEWGRRELVAVEQALRAYAGPCYSTKYARD